MLLPTSFSHQVTREEIMEPESFIQHIERDTEGTPLPLSMTTDWIEDGNDTAGNQFQQPVWQVGERNYGRMHQNVVLLASETQV